MRWSYQEPLNSGRALPSQLPGHLPAAQISEEPKKALAPCLLGSSPSHPKRLKPKKELPVNLNHVSRAVPKGEEVGVGSRKLSMTLAELFTKKVESSLVNVPKSIKIS